MEVTALVDGGATHSAISGTTARKLETLGIARKPTTLRMCDVQGNALDISGSMIIPIQMNNVVKQWPVTIVEKFDAELIIGADFMAAHRLCQDFENKTIEFKDNEEFKWKNKKISVIHKTFIV